MQIMTAGINAAAHNPHKPAVSPHFHKAATLCFARCCAAAGAVPEQEAPAIRAQVRLHALKTACAIVQHLGSWVQLQRPKRHNLGLFPAAFCCVVHLLSQKHR